MARRSVHIVNLAQFMGWVALLVSACEVSEDSASRGFDRLPTPQPSSGVARGVLPDPMFWVDAAMFGDQRLRELGVLALPDGAHGLAVDALGAFSVALVEPAAEPHALTLQHYSPNGLLEWAHSHRCDGQLASGPELFMLQSGTTLVSSAFTGLCNFAGTELESTINPTAEQVGAADAPSTTPHEAASLLPGASRRGEHSWDSVLLAYDALGEQRAVRHVTGSGDQLPLGWAGQGGMAVTWSARFSPMLELDAERVYAERGAASVDTLSVEFEREGLEATSIRSWGALQVSASAHAVDGSVLFAFAEPSAESPSAEGPSAEASAIDAGVQGGSWVAAFGSGEEEIWRFELPVPFVVRALASDVEGNVYVLANGVLPADGAASNGQGLTLLSLTGSGQQRWLTPLIGDVVDARLAVSRLGIAVLGMARGGLRAGSAGFTTVSPHVEVFFVGVSREGQVEQAFSIVAGGALGLGQLTAHPSGGWLAPACFAGDHQYFTSGCQLLRLIP